MESQDLLKVVLDTNVLVSALRAGGGSARVLSWALRQEYLLPCISTALLLEYEEKLLELLPDINRARGMASMTRLRKGDIQLLLDDYVDASAPFSISLTARPALPDPDDEMVLELLLVSGANLVTFNKRDFKAAVGPFKITVCTCAELIKRLTS